MAPLKPDWPRPSHPEIQEVITNEAEFASMSRSRVSLPPFALFAKMAFPPCTLAEEPTYATVQVGRNRHLNLNSDLLYINHSCDPSLIFDTASFNILVGPKGLRPGDELTFFYPSTEWHMAQPFECLCKAPTCRGLISGAEAMSAASLEGVWLNNHIRELLEERDSAAVVDAAGLNGGDASKGTSNGTSKGAGNGIGIGNGNGNGAGNGLAVDDPTAQALKDALKHAELVVEAAKAALVSYLHPAASSGPAPHVHAERRESCATMERVEGAARRGATSRELSGEMGGDTLVV